LRARSGDEAADPDLRLHFVARGAVDDYVMGRRGQGATPRKVRVGAIGASLERAPIAIGGKLVAFSPCPGLPGIAARHRAGEGR